MEKVTELKQVTEKPYWECERCNITSQDKSGRWCPCPRGSCEAKVKGKIVTTVEIVKS